MTRKNNRILIAGIGSGSLGIELLKCFALSDKYQIYGTDISHQAYGHGDSRFIETKIFPVSSNEEYIECLLKYAQEINADIIAPGAEATHRIISEHRKVLFDNGFKLMINSKEVIDLCSDKVACNEFLSSSGFITARTIVASSKSDLIDFDCYPCVIKPAINSGGSNMVFLAENFEEAFFFVDYLCTRGFTACVQEYIDSEDEFTVGVLSTIEGAILTSVALKRSFDSKLSRSISYDNRVISSGWSQGKIDYYPEVCQQAERIAKSLGSTWAINLQGRLRDGIFISFEINPRHSGTSYLRALAGVNEPLIALDYLTSGYSGRPRIQLKVGQYLRVLNEYFMPEVVL